MRSPFERPGLHCDPYPMYREIRREEPIYRISGPDEAPEYLLTRHRDVETLLQDERCSVNRLESRRFRDQLEGLPADLQADRQRPSLLNLDPPDHTRLRKLVSRAFTPRRVEELAPAIERRAAELLDAIDDRGPVDLVEAYAAPLPARVIADILGVPEEDHGRFRAWSDCLLRPLVGAGSDLGAFREARDALESYLVDAADSRRRDARDDLLGALVAAEEDERLDDDEVIATCMLLLVAGHETTTNLIGNGAWLLLSEEGRLEQSLAEPDSAIEELLRYESPIQAVARVTTQALELGETSLPAGSLVSGSIGAANRDPEVFDDPDGLDLTRSPNPHLAFGKGVHFCLGATLARLEARIALPLLFSRLPGLALRDARPAWRKSVLLRGLEHLWVERPRH